MSTLDRPPGTCCPICILMFFLGLNPVPLMLMTSPTLPVFLLKLIRGTTVNSFAVSAIPELEATTLTLPFGSSGTS